MTRLTKILLMAACAAALCFTTGKVQAQGRGNFDPARMRQGMVDSFKDRMSVTNDDEWKVLEAAIGKVVDAQFEARAGSIRGFGGGQRRNRGGNNNDNNGGDTNAPATTRNRPTGFGTPSPEADDLQKAIEAKAPKDEINAKLAKLREANAATEAKLAAAQDDLKKLLTARQEAVAVLYGLLK